MPTYTVESPRLTSKDSQQAKEAAARLLAGEMNLALQPLSPPVIRAVSQLLEKLGGGQKTLNDSVSTITAAKYINVSRPYLVRLLNAGKIAHHMVGTHHRVYIKDLEAYKRKQDKKSQAAMQKLHDLSEELGLYDLEPQTTSE